MQAGTILAWNIFPAVIKTEQEWLTATDPTPMIRSLTNRPSDRKVRLCSVACCRRIWHLFSDATKAVEVTEAYADGDAGVSDLEQVHETTRQYGPQSAKEAALVAAYNASGSWIDCEVAAMYAAGAVAWHATGDDRYAGDVDRGVLPRDEEKRHQAQIVRDIFGNPFRPVTFDPTWRTVTVNNLAAAIYDSRQLPSGLFDNQRLGILADALEDANCDNADLLGHLRGGGEHVRGCWVVDLILGKS